MIEGITRLEHLAADYQSAEKQKNLADAAAEIAENTHEISVDEEMLSDTDFAELSRKSINAAQATDEKQAAVLSFSDAIQLARHAEMTQQELAEESALRQICQEKELQKEYDDLEARAKSLRSLKITAALKELPDYNVLAAIENADAEHKDEDAAPLSNSISLETIQSELAVDDEYTALQAKKSETAAKLLDCAQKVAAQTERLKEINLRLNTPETKQQTQAEALRLFAENQKEHDEYQEASLQEISLLKQKIHTTGTKMAVLQEDVILYRQAIEEAKESYLKELCANAEETLPEIEEKIATTKQRIAEKESAAQEAFASREIPEKDALPMPDVEAKKVILMLPSGYDKEQYRMWVTKVETENKKYFYEVKTPRGALIGNYSGRKAENPGQFYVHRPEENATYTVWRKDLTTGKSEMAAKTKFTDGAMNPLPLPDEARLLYLEKQKQDLLQKKEFISIFQQNKLVSQETFELKKGLQTLDRQLKTSTSQASPSLEHRRRELADKLEKMQEDKKEIQGKMREIRKLFGTKEVKSILTSMANDLTLGDVPQKKTIEALQTDMTADVERVRAILATRIRVMNEQAIADRLADAHRTNALERQRHRVERRYTALEVRKTIYDVLAAIRVEKQTLEKELAPLEERYFSEARARKMAIDVYTENKTKELRQLNRAIEKKGEQLRKSDDKLLAKEYALLNMKKPRWYEQILGSAVNEQYNAMQQEAAQLKQQANSNKAALYSLQVKAAKTETQLNGILKVPEVAAKIEAITQGILNKNQFVADQVFTLRARKTQLTRQEIEFTKLASAATRQIEADRGKNIAYSSSSGGQNAKISIVAMIAKAFDGNGAACAAVARINTDDQSILDWEGKNAAERKAARRESTWDRDEF